MKSVPSSRINSAKCVLLPPGRYCVLINDIGNLTVMNDFAIVLVQP